jgi:hypothetical protein
MGASSRMAAILYTEASRMLYRRLHVEDEG